MKPHFPASILVLLLAGSSFGQHPRADVSGHYLLKTTWGGSAPFNASAPDGSTLGCHSNALAQVFYFHRLAPHGKVSYKCSSGREISEDFTNYRPQWDRFARAKDPGIDAQAIEATSRFMYYVAVVLQKDFGTDQYVGDANDAHKKGIEAHFDCTVTAYRRKVESSIDEAFKAGTDLYALMKAEIDAGRPVGLYYTDRKQGGHAVVVDGYTVKDGTSYFHANFGWFGSSDGWYLLAEDLPKPTQEVFVITVVPQSPEASKGPQEER